MLPKIAGSRSQTKGNDGDDEANELRAYELGLVDEEGNLMTPAQAKAAKYFEDLERQSKVVRDLIRADKNYKYVMMFEEDTRSTIGGGIMKLLKKQIDDFLVPPATRPEYERERREMAKERSVQLAMERRRKALYAEEDEEMKKKAEGDKKKDLQMLRSRLKSLDAPQVTFSKDAMYSDPSRGPLAAVPNLDYSSKSSPLLNYTGGRFQGAPHGQGVQIFSNGDRYEGEWDAGSQEGYGILHFASNDKYSGQWHLGRQEGFGVLETKKGCTYRGQWKHGLKSGYGEYSDSAKCTIFGGEWRNGRRNGFGIKAWLKTGTTFMGEWLDDQKNGDGLLRSNIPALGIGRFFTLWQNGELVKREKYDALCHGTEVLNSATWAAHYAAKASVDSGIVLDQKLSFPLCPKLPEQPKEISAQEISEIPEHIQRFRETWMTKRSQIDGTFSDSHTTNVDDSNKDRSSQILEEQRIQVSARAMRRLISLVHSSDRRVEELVLPILNDAQEVKEAAAGEEAFLVGPVWTKNISLLEDHFASKIQRKWKSLAWRRAFKGAKKALDTSKEEEVENAKLKASELQSKLVSVRKAETQALEEIIQYRSLSTKLGRIIERVDENPTIAELLKKSKMFFGPEMRSLPLEETNDRWTFPEPAEQNVPSISKADATVLAIVNKIEKRKVDEEAEAELGKHIQNDGMVFYGQVVGKIPHGFGTASYPDGSVYSGQFACGLRDGVGEYTRQDEIQQRSVTCTYIGEWRDNLRHGFAVELCKAYEHYEILLNCVRSEYKNDELVSSESIEERDCAEWIQECNTASSWAKRAALEARELMDEVKKSKSKSVFSMSRLILFSLDEGFSTFFGEMDNENGRHGSGVQEWNDGRRYAGDWSHDAFDGFGREDVNGSTYTGQFKAGKKHGFGRLSSPEGNSETIYLGEWSDGMRHGRGIERREIEVLDHGREVEWVATVEYMNDVLVNLESFNHVKMREFVDDADHAVRNGARAAGRAFPATRIEYTGGQETALWYVGGRLDGLRSGSGVLVMRDGTRYVGDFLRDAADGYGVETYPDGSVYSGQFKDSQRHGFGKYVTTRGMMHLGEWSKGLREGRALQRSLVKLASGSITREYLVEFTGDEEVERKLVKNRHVPWMKLAESAVKRGEETAAVTVSIYQDLLD